MNTSRTLNAGVLVLGQGARALVMVLIAAVLSRLLSKDDYASYRQVFLVFSIASPLLLLGLPAALLYFLPRCPDRTRGVLLEVLIVISVLAALFGFGMLLGGNRLIAVKFNNPDLVELLTWSSFYPLLMLPVLALDACLIAFGKVLWVAAFTLLAKLILLASVVVPVLIIPDAKAAVIGTVVSGALTLPPALYLMFRAATAGPARPTRVGMKELLWYAVPLGLGTMIGTINKMMGQTVVASFSSKADFAVFVNGAMEIPLIAMITGSAAGVIIPDLARHFAKGEYGAAISLWQRAAVKCGLIIIPVSGLCALVAPELMQSLYGQSFIASALPFQIYLILLPWRVVMYGALFQAAGRSDIVLKRSALNFFVNAALVVLFVKMYGAVGAAVGTVVATLGFAIPYCVFSAARIYKVGFWELMPVRELGVLVGVTVTALVPVWVAKSYLTSGTWWLDGMLAGACYGIVIVPLLLFSGAADWNMVKALPARLKAKLRSKAQIED